MHNADATRGTLLATRLGDIPSQYAIRLTPGFDWITWTGDSAIATLRVQLPRGPVPTGAITSILTATGGGNSLNVTAILSGDRDGDGIPDAYEEDNGLNPDVNDNWKDPDNDGVDNLREFRLGTRADTPDNG